MKVSTILNDIAKELGDPTMVTWTRPTLISLLNQAVKQVILVRPDAYSVTELFVLAAGTKQDLPANALRLLNITRNMGVGGATPGRSIRLTTDDLLNAFDPDWHSKTPKAVISSYVYDESTPDVFYVNPPADGTTQIEVQVSRVPDELDPDMDDATYNNAATVVGLSDIYVNPLMEWVLYKTFSFEASSASSVQTANTHMNSFYNALGVKTKSDVMNSPNSANAAIK